MTRKPEDLSESSRVLYQDFRDAGLSEADAIEAVFDFTAYDAAVRIKGARTWNGLSEADTRKALKEIGEASAKRRSEPVSLAEFDARLGRVFDRPRR